MVIKKELNWPVNSFAPFFIESQKKWKILMPEYVSFKATFSHFLWPFHIWWGTSALFSSRTDCSQCCQPGCLIYTVRAILWHMQRRTWTDFQCLVSTKNSSVKWLILPNAVFKPRHSLWSPANHKMIKDRWKKLKTSLLYLHYFWRMQKICTQTKIKINNPPFPCNCCSGKHCIN